MKILISLAVLTLLLAACNKDDDNSNCKLDEAVTYNNAGTMIGRMRYEYDNQGRVSKIVNVINPQYSSIISYYTDSILVAFDNIKTKYYLNSTGNADSASSIIPNSPEQLKFYYKYTYDAEGYLTTERLIYSQFYNGSTIYDTINTVYTIQNGNVIRVYNSQTPEDVIYEYSSAIRPANNPAINIPYAGALNFLGKPSKFLVSVTKNPAGAIITQYSYQYDKKGNLIEMNSTGAKTTYSYKCN